DVVAVFAGLALALESQFGEQGGLVGPALGLGRLVEQGLDGFILGAQRRRRRGHDQSEQPGSEWTHGNLRGMGSRCVSSYSRVTRRHFSRDWSLVIGHWSLIIRMTNDQ